MIKHRNSRSQSKSSTPYRSNGNSLEIEVDQIVEIEIFLECEAIVEIQGIFCNYHDRYGRRTHICSPPYY